MGSRYIVSIETVKIKNFLFSTNKLKVIRGASYLLDVLNQIKVKEILCGSPYNLKEDEDIIYIGAGNAKFFVDDFDTMQNIIRDIKNIYKLEAPGAHIAAAYTKTNYKAVEKDPKHTNKVWDDVDELGKLIAIEKNKGFPTLNIDMHFFEKCEFCSTNPAQVNIDSLKEDICNIKGSLLENNIDKLSAILDKTDYTQGFICEECLKKINAGTYIKEKNASIGFYKYLSDRGISPVYASSIDDYGNNKNFIGFMYSDGDGLGDFLKNVADNYKNMENGEEEYLKFLKNFSITLDNNTKEAMKIAMDTVFIKENRPVKGEFLIVGGDDVCAVFEAELVLEISRIFQTEFEVLMKEYTKPILGDKPRITSSCGVIIAKAKTPIYQLFDQAMVLQKKAKAKRYDFKKKYPDATETGFIDFEVIGSEGCVDITRFRDSISTPDNQLLERPYSIKDLKLTDIKPISSLFEIITELKKQKFPKNKLLYIYELKRADKKEFEKKMDIVDTISKMDEIHIKTLAEYFDLNVDDYKNFNHMFTNIFDILEIYDFVRGDNNEN